MPDRKVRVLNFDDSVIKQKRLLSRYNPGIIDLKDMGPASRFWLDPGQKKDLAARIRGPSGNFITLLGSGDFHHISNILISEFKEPLCVIDFDLHPDWTILPPALSCSSWVTATLKNENVLKIIILGISPAGTGIFSIQAGNFRALEGDRVEIYPYSHRPSTVLFRAIPANISVEADRGLIASRIRWNELKQKNLTEFFMHMIKRLPAKNVYISIDKDCLKREYAMTNWQPGVFSLEELLLVLKIIRDNLNIVGADITGDYSDINIKEWAKRVISHIDHPKNFSAKGAQDSYITSVNETTNISIIDLLSG